MTSIGRHHYTIALLSRELAHTQGNEATLSKDNGENREPQFTRVQWAQNIGSGYEYDVQAMGSGYGYMMCRLWAQVMAMMCRL